MKAANNIVHQHFQREDLQEQILKLLNVPNWPTLTDTYGEVTVEDLDALIAALKNGKARNNVNEKGFFQGNGREAPQVDHPIVVGFVENLKKRIAAKDLKIASTQPPDYVAKGLDTADNLHGQV